jgi:hypothetical protein
MRLLVAVSAAHAEMHVALVIGVAAYKNTATLQNRRNDAQDAAEALKRVGLDTIIALDLDKSGMGSKSILQERRSSGQTWRLSAIADTCRWPSFAMKRICVCGCVLLNPARVRRGYTQSVSRVRCPRCSWGHQLPPTPHSATLAPMMSGEHQQTPSADVLLAAAHARAVERVKLTGSTVTIPLLSVRRVKIASWRVLAIISMPFVLWGIFAASWHMTSLFFEPLTPGHDPRDAALHALTTSPHPRGRGFSIRRSKSRAMIAMRRKGRSWHHHLN